MNTVSNVTTQSNRIPVAIVTGFLGAGKTTLIKRLLSEEHGKRIAVIKNEIGDMAIDAGLIAGSSQTILELDNGCLCCSVHDDLVRILNELGARKQDFEYLIIETTGIANPGPVINTFRNDKRIAADFAVDSVICVADAAHLLLHINSKEVQEQLAIADIILLNKVDLVTDDDLQAVEDSIRTINALSEIHRTQNSQIELRKILQTDRFSALHLDEAEAARIQCTNAENDHDHDHCEHSHDHDHGDCSHDHSHASDHIHEDGHEHSHGHDHHHLDHAHHSEDIQSIGIEEKGTLDPRLFNTWLKTLIRTKGNDIFRMKGIVSVAGNPDRVVFHAVHLVSQFTKGAAWENDEVRTCKVVFIGRHLDRQSIKKGFAGCFATA
jgi:G3E family GTPase